MLMHIVQDYQTLTTMFSKMHFNFEFSNSRPVVYMLFHNPGVLFLR